MVRGRAASKLLIVSVPKDPYKEITLASVRLCVRGDVHVEFQNEVLEEISCSFRNEVFFPPALPNCLTYEKWKLPKLLSDLVLGH